MDLKLNPIDDEYTQKWPDYGCHCHVDNATIVEDNDDDKGDDYGNEEDLEDDDDNEEDVRMKSCWSLTPRRAISSSPHMGAN